MPDVTVNTWASVDWSVVIQNHIVFFNNEQKWNKLNIIEQ